MSEKENIGYVLEASSGACSESDVNRQRKDNCSTEKQTFDLKDCSDVVEDIQKEAAIPYDDDESSVSDYSSSSEEYDDPVGQVPFEKAEQCAKCDDPVGQVPFEKAEHCAKYDDPLGQVPFEETEQCVNKELNDDENEEIELDEEQLKEMQNGWSDKDVQMHQDEALSLKDKGNEHFKNARYMEAIESYTQALNVCPLKSSPERAVLYANRAAAKIGLEKKEEAVLDCNKAIELNPSYLKAILRRAQLHRKLENLDQCLADYQKVLELDRNSREAREACLVLPQEIAKRNEKLKTEMLGQLKQFGNTLLQPFGLSTDNFNVVKDPNTGGYNVNFQNNKNGK